ncbi:MAG: UDP-N-acetylglucosamine 2-epimerase [Acidobacteriota bacterium]
MSDAKRRICVILVDRANYGRLKPVMRAVQQRPELELITIAAGSMLLERFQQPVDVVRADGFRVESEIFMELEGSTPTTMAKSVGFGVIEFSSELQRLKPDFVLMIGDRYEALSAAVAAAFMNLPIVHMQGGEVSGSIDESTRHAISKLAHYHYPATARAAENLVRMGERRETILGVGCPSSDIARELDRALLPEDFNAHGSGIEIDPSQPYLLLVFHPTTTEFGDERDQMQQLLEALDEIRLPTLFLWPNIDAGSDHISKTVRIFRDRMTHPWLRTLTNLTPETYLKVLAGAACAVGNSSSFVRDSSFFATPVVLVGNRQNGREVAENVVRVEASRDEIASAVRSQLAHGPYPPSRLYGDGEVSTQLAARLVEIEPYLQKRIHFEGDHASEDSDR